MAVIPTPPVFTDLTTPTRMQLQALAQSVQFLTNTDYRPTWHVYRHGSLTISSSDTWTAVPMSSVAVDTDGVSVAAEYAANIVTTGYYGVEACIAFNNPATANVTFAVCMGILPGANNPNLSGSEWYLFGYRAGQSAQTNATGGLSDFAYTVSDITPWPVYPGDQMAGFAWCNSTCVVDYNNNDSYMLGRWSCNFTGTWIHHEDLTPQVPSTWGLNSTDP